MATAADRSSPPAGKRRPLDRRPWYRWFVGIAGTLLSLLCGWAVVRYLAGIAPSLPTVRTPAVAAHVMAVIPAVPLGAYLILSPKGDARHRLLGKIWLVLMLVTAISAIFIRTINPGHFSWIHLFVVLALVSVPRAYLAARRGDIAAHRSIIAGFYAGAALGAGFAAFLPHRAMWWMAFG